MFYAARAVLFKAAGSAPKRRDGVIQKFGLLVRDLDDALRAAGKVLNAVKDERTAADYDETIIASSEETRAAVQVAADFMAVCGTHFALRASAP